MTDLITRLENAGEGDRELDAMVQAQIMRWECEGDEEIEADGGAVSVYLNMRRISKSAAPKLTTSFDAIIALIEEKLPDCSWSVEKIGSWVEAELHNYPINYRKLVGYGCHKTAPLALCVAFLKAIQESE